MKFSTILQGLIVLSTYEVIPTIRGSRVDTSSYDIASATVTAPPDAKLVKRIDADYIERQRQKLKEGEAKAHGAEEDSETDGPQPWIRTIYGSVVERVVPTVVQGVTLSAKPPKETNGLEPWISLKKDGSPQTIHPKLKDGHTKNPSPTYGTWFATPTTIVYTKEQLKAHNMADDETHTEVEWIDDDNTYHVLNPIIRCTPDSYFKKGLNKNVLSKPFCFPKDNSVLKATRSYFITWYSKYFDSDVKNVRFHLSAVKPSLHDQGLKKRSAIMENGGQITLKSFWTSDWLANDMGMYPIDIVESMFENDSQMERKVLLSIQPDNVDDGEFDYLKDSLVLELIRPGSVYKHHNEDLKLLEEKQKLAHLNTEIEEGIDYDKYFAIMGIPTFVIILAFGMYIFAWCNKVDLSDLKSKRPRSKLHNHRRIPFMSKKNKGYSSLPQHNADIPLQSFKND